MVLASLWFDGASLPTTGLPGLLGHWGAWILRWVVGFAGLFASFTYLRFPQAATLPLAAIRPGLIAANLASFAAFFALSRQLYQGSPSDAGVALWLVLALAVGLTACLAFIPLPTWLALHRLTGYLWLASAAASTLACALIPALRLLWAPATRTTFALVELMLGALFPQIVYPAPFRLGTPRFAVTIAPECSGLEGVGLFVIFAVIWLVLFRDELRFPRALLLLPVGIVALYLANSVRIAALIVLGDAGYPDIARRGFHSQAGWISFNLIAFGLLLLARRSPWLSRTAVTVHADEEEHPAAPFLLPFLAILAGGMVAGAFSAGFEWLYALRVLACVAVLWWFRREYRSIDWRFGWLAPVLGLVVFALWMIGDSATRQMPTALSQAAPAASLAWIAFRLLGGVVTVPIAEELAFRAFGLRRLISPDFDSVPWRRFTWPALLISSILFGLMHGDRWLAGAVAGALYAAAVQWRGRLGDAVVAHATTNALLAVWVIAFGRWDLW